MDVHLAVNVYQHIATNKHLHANHHALVFLLMELTQTVATVMLPLNANLNIATHLYLNASLHVL